MKYLYNSGEDKLHFYKKWEGLVENFQEDDKIKYNCILIEIIRLLLLISICIFLYNSNIDN